jgi:hypothetical protein
MMVKTRNEVRHFATAVSDPLVARILSFGALGDGWHYGKGKSAPMDVVFRALLLRTVLANLGADRFEAFPIASGEILVSGYHRNETVDIRVSHQNKYGVFHERADVDIIDESDLSLKQVLGYLQSLPWRQQNTSDLFIPSIIAMNLDDLRALPSRNQTTEHRYLIPNARITLAGDANVATYEHFIPQESQVIHQYSYEYPPKSYLLPAS